MAFEFIIIDGSIYSELFMEECSKLIVVAWKRVFRLFVDGDYVYVILDFKIKH